MSSFSSADGSPITGESVTHPSSWPLPVIALDCRGCLPSRQTEWRRWPLDGRRLSCVSTCTICQLHVQNKTCSVFTFCSLCFPYAPPVNSVRLPSPQYIAILSCWWTMLSTHGTIQILRLVGWRYGLWTHGTLQKHMLLSATEHYVLYGVLYYGLELACPL
jgi:hypothetical protein